MLHSTRSRALAALLVVVMAAAACSGAGSGDAVESDPKGALVSAVQSLGDYQGYDLVLRLLADEQTLAAMAESGELSETEVRLLTTSSLRVQTRAGATPDPAQSQAAFAFVLGGEPVAEVRSITGDLFVRVDLPAIQASFPDDTAGLDTEALVAEAEEFGLGEVAAAVRDGRWIQLAGLEQLMGMFGGMAGQPQPGSSEAAELSAEMVQALQGFVQDLEASYVGAEDPGAHVTATADADAIRELARGYLDVVSEVLPGGMGISEQQIQQQLEGITAQIPDDFNLPIEAWIDDGRVTQLGVDLPAVAEAVGDDADIPDDIGQFLAVVEIAEFTDSVEAPTDALQVDLFELFGRFMGQGLGQMSSESASISGTPTESPRPEMLIDGDPSTDIPSELDVAEVATQKVSPSS